MNKEKIKKTRPDDSAVGIYAGESIFNLCTILYQKKQKVKFISLFLPRRGAKARRGAENVGKSGREIGSGATKRDGFHGAAGNIILTSSAKRKNQEDVDERGM